MSMQTGVAQPFLLRFMSDAYEISGAATKEAANIDRGFMLAYFMDSNNCTWSAY